MRDMAPHTRNVVYGKILRPHSATLTQNQITSGDCNELPRNHWTMLLDFKVMRTKVTVIDFSFFCLLAVCSHNQPCES